MERRILSWARFLFDREISEHDWHDASEAGIHFFAGGHNATEQFGVQSLMKLVQNELELDCKFIASENPA